MPYTVKGKCVYKKKADGSQGEKVGCTEGDINDYLAALHARADETTVIEITRRQLRQIIKEVSTEWSSTKGAHAKLLPEQTETRGDPDSISLVLQRLTDLEGSLLGPQGVLTVMLEKLNELTPAPPQNIHAARPEEDQP